MVNPVLIVGSAPISASLDDVDLSSFQRVAINKSWRLRSDFEYHVYLRSLGGNHKPPASAQIQGINHENFRNPLNAAGGIYICSGSVAMIAGYWALPALVPKVISYFGCDLVFSPNDDGQTHYYGVGDSGPLLGNFSYNLRQEERSIRLFCWGLLHNTLIVNGSGEDGSLLAFPKIPLEDTKNSLLRKACKAPVTGQLIEKAGVVFAYEISNRSSTFGKKQELFEADQTAVQQMNEMMDRWGALATLVEELCDVLEK